jgi:Raf kinase inhibitor-like YbhB/YbcL family protein
MRITSPAFESNQEVPTTYTCEGLNISPPLQFEEVPAATQSMVLMVEDPDAPGKAWVHWLVFNIPPTTTLVEEGTIPEGGVEGVANGGTHGYEGPCPPSGEHRYVFTLYAINTVLALDPLANKDEVIKSIEGFILERADLVGIYRLKNPGNAPV